MIRKMDKENEYRYNKKGASFGAPFIILDIDVNQLNLELKFFS